MAKYFHEYATMKGFSPLEHTKDCFTSNQFSNLFSGESNHSLVIDNSEMTMAYGDVPLNTNQNKKYSRRGHFFCSSKSHGHIKGAECCFTTMTRIILLISFPMIG